MNEKSSQEKQEQLIKKWEHQYLHSFFENNHKNLIFSSILIWIQALAIVYIAYLMQQILDTAIDGQMKGLFKLLVTTMIFFAFYLLIGFALRKTRNDFVEKAIFQYKQFVYQRIMERPIHSFDKETTGSYLSALTNDMAGVGGGFLQNIFSIIAFIPMLFGPMIMMIYYSPKLTMISLLFLVIPIILSSLFGDRVIQVTQRMSYQGERFVSTLKELLSGFTVIKSFKAELSTARIFSKENLILEEVSNQKRKTEDLLGLISNSSGFIAQIGVYLVGGIYIIRGEVTAGIVLAFMQLSEGVLSMLFSIPSLYATMMAGRKLVQKLILLVESTEQDKGTKPVDFEGKGITLESVSFSYDNTENALSNINFNFELGKSYAIIGASGSGKTTLVNLLMGGYQDYQGKIRINGTVLQDIQIDSLYDFYSVIQQNVFIFDNTILENITMFKEFSQEEIDQAIEKAGLKTVITEKGMNYRCGENGSGLSGGERQRISIARSLLRKTPVLVLDEATAALDYATSYMVEDAILNIKDLTRIVITHKLDQSLLTRYDSLIVMSQGKIIETGRFDELIKKQGLFYSLFHISNVK